MDEDDGLEEDRIDDESDRDHDHAMVDRRIRALYADVWYTGVVTWYNTKLNEFHLSFEDGSEDYINIDDVNGTDMMFDD
jgi:hypothetical protein